MEYDCLCDLVSFGVAPALLAYLWALEPYGRYGWLAAFLYVATTALRLARFNSLALEKSPQDFVGLPCPAAAGMIATTVLFSRYLGATDTVKHISLLILVYVLSYLMVSNFGYMSFKHPAAKRKKTFQVTVIIVLLMILVAAEPQVTLFVIGSIYVLSGPLRTAYRFMHRTDKEAEEQENII
jgi:CDP-diacylglycerol--serine O-phosphatidyltransferase